jgi:hypothetical protein
LYLRECSSWDHNQGSIDQLKESPWRHSAPAGPSSLESEGPQRIIRVRAEDVPGCW